MQSEVQMLPTQSLTPHPSNYSIYGNCLDASLVDSVQSLGIIDPLVVNQSRIILSGHRRWLAAKQVNLETVPALVRTTADELEDRIILLHSNRQRSKTTEQLAREAQALMQVEVELARRRQQATLKQNATVVENVPPRLDDSGKARDKVGEALGLSGKTVDKMVAIVEKVDELKQAGKDEDAAAITDALNNKSVRAAYRIAFQQAWVVKPSPARASTADGDASQPAFCYASLCSGIEGASVAWKDLGWQPDFFAEIDPFCCELLAERYPGIPNLGDIAQITAAMSTRQQKGGCVWTFSSQEHPANRSRLQVCDWVWAMSVASWPLNFCELFRSASLAGLFGRTSLAFCQLTEEERLAPSSGDWLAAGMGSPTASWTLATSEFPSVAVESTLSDIVEPTTAVPSSLYLTAQQVSRMRDRLQRHGKKPPAPLASIFGDGPETLPPSSEKT